MATSAGGAMTAHQWHTHKTGPRHVRKSEAVDADTRNAKERARYTPKRSQKGYIKAHGSVRTGQARSQTWRGPTHTGIHAVMAGGVGLPAAYVGLPLDRWGGHLASTRHPTATHEPRNADAQRTKTATYDSTQKG